MLYRVTNHKGSHRTNSPLSLYIAHHTATRSTFKKNNASFLNREYLPRSTHLDRFGAPDASSPGKPQKHFWPHLCDHLEVLEYWNNRDCGIIYRDMKGRHIQQSMYQPGKVANLARGQPNMENIICFPVPRVRAREFGVAKRVRPSRPASACSFSAPRLNVVVLTRVIGATNLDNLVDHFFCAPLFFPHPLCYY